MSSNHNVSARDIRRELTEAGWRQADAIGSDEVWVPADGTTARVRFRSDNRFGPKQAHSVRRSIAAHAGVAVAIDNAPRSTELVGPAVPEEGGIFSSLQEFYPPLPVGTMLIVRQLDPVVVADAPVLHRHGIRVERWAADVPIRPPAEPVAPVVAPDTIRDQVLAWLRGRTDYSSAKAISEAIVRDQNSVRNQLYKMESDGVVESEVSGTMRVRKYRIRPEGGRALGAVPADAQEHGGGSTPSGSTPSLASEVCSFLRLPDGAPTGVVMDRLRSVVAQQREVRRIAADAGAPDLTPVESARWLADRVATERGAHVDSSREAAARKVEIDAAAELLRGLGIAPSGRGLAGMIERLAARTSSAEEQGLRREVERLQAVLASRPEVTPGQEIPGWPDDRIAALAETLGAVDALRWLLGRAPNREELIAAALGALGERLGRTS